MTFTSIYKDVPLIVRGNCHEEAEKKHKHLASSASGQNHRITEW